MKPNKTKECKALRVDSQIDRENLIVALVNSGYTVKLTKRKVDFEDRYYVVYESISDWEESNE